MPPNQFVKSSALGDKDYMRDYDLINKFLEGLIQDKPKLARKQTELYRINCWETGPSAVSSLAINIEYYRYHYGKASASYKHLASIIPLCLRNGGRVVDICLPETDPIERKCVLIPQIIISSQNWFTFSDESGLDKYDLEIDNKISDMLDIIMDWSTLEVLIKEVHKIPICLMTSLQILKLCRIVYSNKMDTPVLLIRNINSVIVEFSKFTNLVRDKGGLRSQCAYLVDVSRKEPIAKFSRDIATKCKCTFVAKAMISEDNWELICERKTFHLYVIYKVCIYFFIF